jgi:hypothetical protein
VLRSVLPVLFWLTSYHSEVNFLNTVDETVLFETPVYSWLNTDLGARLGFSKEDIENFDYKIGVSSPLLSFFTLGLRLSHENQLVDSTALTSFLLYGRLHSSPFKALNLFLTTGWYKRYTVLTKSTILPTPWHNSYSEHDFAFELGFDLFPEEKISGQLKAATFDAMEVFNLNNPYAEISLGYLWDPNWKVTLYSRYKVLLGFGRLDEFRFGAGLIHFM